MNDEREPESAYVRLEYSRFVAWSDRIRREAPLLLEALSGSGGLRRVLDLGCGTGEHSRFLAAEGFEVVGVDVSEAALQQARSENEMPGVCYLEGPLEALGSLVEGRFSSALCLGNTLVHLVGHEQMRRFLEGLGEHLEEGGVFFFQILNYARLRSTNQRHLPVNFQPDGDGTRAFLRLMEFLPEGRVDFYPTLLRYGPGRTPAVEVVQSSRVELRGWGLEEMADFLHRAGFKVEKVFGDFAGKAYDPASSNDLIVQARKSGLENPGGPSPMASAETLNPRSANPNS